MQAPVMQHDPLDERVSDALVRRFKPLYDFLRRYHRYEVVGLEHIPSSGPALIVFTHSLATYDIVLLGATVYFERHRLIRALTDRLVMKTPLLNDFARSCKAVVGEPRTARSLLEAGYLVGVAPGGMREALRPSSQRYEIDWRRRYGFARLALETGAPVILAACPAADDLYTVFENPLTRLVYERLRMPLPLAFGLALTALPRPIKLVHHLSEPIQPPRLERPPSEDQVHAFQEELASRMRALIREALGEDAGG